jgi:integrase
MTALPRDLAPLAPDLAERLATLFARGTPRATVRAYERDLVYLAAWKHAAFAAPLAWPEDEAVALRFVLDHAEDLSEADPAAPARRVAERLIALGLRRSLARPAPATLDRRIASWRAFHGFRDLASPFERPILKRARAAARRAAGHRPRPKAATPVTREVLDRLVAACPPGIRGIRDRAILEFAWASGGRRRSEIARLERTDLDLAAFDEEGVVRLALGATKTTAPGATPRLMLKGLPARMLVAWLDAGGIEDGPVFRAISKGERVLDRGLSDSGLRDVFRAIAARAGLAPGATSLHGLRSGFLTQASRDRVPLQAATRLSLHRSLEQAGRYYQDADLADNPAIDLRESGREPPAKPSTKR